ncbi:MAG: hypothetical protein WBP12_01170, partial [Candidatus Saccharimonas sp.]
MATIEAVQNPIGEFCATLTDLVEETPLAVVDFTLDGNVDYITVEGVSDFIDDTVYAHRVRDDGTHEGLARALWDCGITPIPSHRVNNNQWSDRHFTFVNTPKNRQLAVRWLYAQQTNQAIEAAKAIINNYIGEFVELCVERIDND